MCIFDGHGTIQWVSRLKVKSGHLHIAVEIEDGPPGKFSEGWILLCGFAKPV
jgi:hypothetical protein